MRTSRRIFLKSAVGLTGAATAFHASAASRFLPGQIGKWKLADTKEYLNICCYCSGGCGTICSVRDGQLINIEGDPDNPVNLGGLCPKGAGLTGLRKIVDKDRRLVMHPHRLTQPLVRRPGSSGLRLSTRWRAKLRKLVTRATLKKKTVLPSTVARVLQATALLS